MIGANDFAAEIGTWNGIRPIETACVQAALDLRRLHLRGWAASAEALTQMDRDLSDQTLSSILGKSAAVNDLYNAQLGSAVLPMARHILKLSAENGLELPGDAPADVVERIGFMGKPSADRVGCLVFASKYAHFFVNPRRIPIYDKYAAQALLFHWGSFEATVMDGRHRYRNFCVVLDRVLAQSKLPRVSLGDLDAYLWLSGVYREWLRNHAKAEINAEAKTFFDTVLGNAEIQGLLAALVPVGPFTDDLPHARVPQK